MRAGRAFARRNVGFMGERYSRQRLEHPVHNPAAEVMMKCPYAINAAAECRFEYGLAADLLVPTEPRTESKREQPPHCFSAGIEWASVFVGDHSSLAQLQ